MNSLIELRVEHFWKDKIILTEHNSILEFFPFKLSKWQHSDAASYLGLFLTSGAACVQFVHSPCKQTGCLQVLLFPPIS